MKKVLSIIFVSLLVMVMAGCSDDRIADVNQNSQSAQRLTVTGTILQDETRVALTDNGTSITPAWEVDDQVFGFYGENKLTYKVASIADGVATFTLESGTEPTDGTTVYMIYAPGKSASDIEANQLAVDLSAQDGTLAGLKNHAIMCATATVSGSALDLKFENQVAIVGVKQFTGLKESTTYTSATFTCFGPTAKVKVVGGVLKLETANTYGTITATGSFASDESGKTTSTIYFAVPPASAVEHMFYLNSASDDRIGSISSKAIAAGKFIYMTTKSMRGYVDLGLPSGSLWAICNVGASGIEDYGDFYAWGETEIQNPARYWWDTYKFGRADKNTLTKYCIIQGSNPDGKTRLEPEDDAAHVKWGGLWYMPTKAQLDELINSTYTTCEWTNNYNETGIKGEIITSKSNGKSIFLPAGGIYDYSTHYENGTACHYASCELYSGDDGAIYNLRFNSTENETRWGRCGGRPVRPVLMPLSFVVTTGTTDGHAWVQLWKGGPKWAEFNVGSTLTDYANATGEGTSWGGADSPYSNENCGGHYSFKGNKDMVAGAKAVSDTATDLWGSNWATPSTDDFNNMLSQCSWVYCDGSTVQYVPGCTLKGWKVTGKGEYQANSIFLPLAGISDQNKQPTQAIGERGCYWSSVSGGYGAYILHLDGSSSTSVSSHNQPHGCSVRAICKGE